MQMKKVCKNKQKKKQQLSFNSRIHILNKQSDLPVQHDGVDFRFHNDVDVTGNPNGVSPAAGRRCLHDI